MNIYYVAAIWLGMALLASLVSIKIAVPAALVEIVVGALAGNIPGIREHVTQTSVVVFLASVGDVDLLPRVLDAAERFAGAPDDAAMSALADRTAAVPLFV